jgi:riboflavin biosynthesis pyrimidine reductase
MRALLPNPDEDVDLHAYYADGWIDEGGIRFDMVASADGAASAAGLSAGLQTPGDNRVFAAQRDLADVIVAGSRTVLTEGYRPVRDRPGRRAVRTRFGLSPVPPIAVLSRSLDLDPALPLFDGSATARTLVLTRAAADPARRAALAATCEVIDCGDQDVEPARVRAALAERGLRRVLSEGGPTVLAAFAAAGELDELCLSLTPLLAGPVAPRILSGPAWTGGTLPLALTGLLEEDGALFCRYRVPRGT